MTTLYAVFTVLAILLFIVALTIGGVDVGVKPKPPKRKIGRGNVQIRKKNGRFG